MLRAVFLLVSVRFSAACSNLLVSAKASETGSPQVAYTADDGGLFGRLKHYPAADHPAGAMRDIWDQDTGRYLGQIPEASHTYNVIGDTGGMNEHQLAIGETTFGGLEALAGQEGALVDYNTLMTIALQRTKTARSAIALMGDLVARYGYASEGESFSIADTREVWIMEMIGKGPGEKGAVWVARRVPDGSACAHANQARIRTWPRDDPDNTMYANDTVDFAIRKGLFPANADPSAFSFSDTFAPVDFFGSRLGEARAYNMLKEITDDSGFAAQYLDYAQGHNNTNRMPLFVKAKETLSVNASMWLMRTRFTGTWFDERNDVGAGAFHAEYRQRPLLWHHEGKSYVNERTVGVQQNGWHFVATPRASVPAPAGGIIWWGVDDQSLSVRFPMYAASTGVPATWQEKRGEVDRLNFAMRSADWAFNLVSNYAYSRWGDVYPIVQQKIVDTERGYFADVAATDAAALKAMREQGPEAAVRVLTTFSMETGDKLVDTWNALFGYLFARFRDGFIATQPPVAHPKDIPTPACAEPGYDEAWKTRIVAEAGDKYRGYNSSGPDLTAEPLINPRLSRTRMRYM